ncbi:dihydrofolate synthase / folylpolyglutamate synthase [Steroidobacter denitrificans]|uniref:Dihydrofolate synthase/folylpolyglutamate synthase n=1 Tax=Steroidobacter denitrificans TaxID=465721 RepID=A0A127FAN9_STEDE|nr:bifunctional tetrahydrofolate synthase/dihydrofolate synthase [Steroidobacter denitrificans]AMN47492.1 dihydrofolate synthase / folylpolyglutamate synthase [Steroidobacter denitrificans]
MRFDRLSDWLGWQQALHPSVIDLGLTRVRQVLAHLHWQRPACPIITIGGTNGKGSSVALLTCILAEAGYRVGSLSSPHLLRYNERITIAGREISDASLVAAFARIDAARGADTLTFFEFNTLAALLVFETAGLDAIVLEVGMGGRLDAVNVVDADVAMITSIALDHCDWLGHDLEAIAREKAGIMRAARPVIFGSREVPAAIRAAARTLDSDLRCLGHDFDWTRAGRAAAQSPAGWNWHGRQDVLEGLPRPALQGDIQFDNASAVLAALACLSVRLPVGRAAIERGLMRVHLPGRFQIIDAAESSPAEWILDVAHNPQAAHSLAGQLAQRPCRGRTIAVCGILGDKDAAGIVAPLQAAMDAWIVVGLDSPRALQSGLLADRLRQAGAGNVSDAPDVAAGCRAAAAMARPGDRIVVFGSFLTVGPALDYLRSRRFLGTAQDI